MVELNKRRILITGGCGFVGYHLAVELTCHEENQVVLVDNFVRGKHDNDLRLLLERQNIQLINGDLTNPKVFDQLGTGFDEVYHLAAIIGVRNVLDRPQEVVRINAIATLLLLNWFVNGGGKKILFSSTSEAYAWTQQFYQIPIPTPENVPLSLTDLHNPRSSYAGSKIFGELAVTQYCIIHNKPFVIVRYHNVYGPRMGFEHVIPELYQRALGGQNPLVVYSANHRRAFCYVSDAVTATIQAMRKEVANGKTFNIGNDREEVSIAKLASNLLEIAKIRVDISEQVAENDPIKRRCPDISQARELLGYEPKISLRKGLEMTFKWYKNKF
jgi:UDP-glucose 4-epimerase